jgi:maleylpyruvate isomerase
VNPDDFPTLRRVEARCAALPAFQAAHPDAQPDAVKP